jgi:hypothetical protein
MNPLLRLAAFGLALVAVFAAAAAVGSAVGPLERGRTDTRHSGEPLRDVEPAGLAVADGGFRLVALQTRLVARKAQGFAFRIMDERGRPLRSYDVAHARRMHVVVVRRDLTGFQHVHPTLERDGTWSVRLRPLAPGAYRAFADFTTAGEKRVLGTDLFVGGRAALLRVPPPNRGTLTGPFQVYLNSRQPSAGETVTLRFGVRKELARVVLEPYLGARGHLVVLREGDLAYLHVHAHADALAFETTFPSPGRYRAFLEFSAGGRVYTAPFTIDVAW